MKAVLALLLVAAGAAAIYTGYTGHLPGKAATPDTGGNQNAFAGLGDYTGPGPVNLQGAATATDIARIQQNPWLLTVANGVGGGLPK